jgi:cyclohexadienyl dehydratase
MRKFIISLLLSILSFNFSSAQSNAELDRMYKLMAQRAGIMKEVAAQKWLHNHKSTVYNSNQELKVLNNAESVAIKNNLKPNSLLVFIQIQMDLSKHIEQYWFDYWNNQSTPKESFTNDNSTINLQKLRERIKIIDNNLFKEIVKNLNLIHKISVEDLTDQAKHLFINLNGEQIKGISYSHPDYLKLLISALKEIQLSYNMLIVCTPGDYPPMAYYNPETQIYSGFDIEVIKSFANKFNYVIQFKKTTWASLNEELENKCDVAVGGITKTQQRSQLFYTSDKVLSGKKEPIFTKQNNSMFEKFSDINQSSVTVIENKGGTNESFAKSHITNADLQILQTNESVYTCLNEYPERPYVMLTDSIEVEWRSSTNQSLSSNGLNFTIPNNPETEKVYLINKHSDGNKIKNQINHFLKTEKNSISELYQNAIHQEYNIPVDSCPI